MELPETPCQFDRDNLILRLHQKVKADVTEISPLVEKIMGAIGEMECARDSEFEVELALREALANAIVHGCKEDRSSEIEVLLACDKTRGMLVIIRDPGPGFDPNSIPSPVQGENIYSSGGRGVYLINQLMDEVHYQKGGTEIHMIKRPADQKRQAD